MEHANEIDIAIYGEGVGGKLSFELSDSAFSAVITDISAFPESGGEYKAGDA